MRSQGIVDGGGGRLTADSSTSAAVRHTNTNTLLSRENYTDGGVDNLITEEAELELLCDRVRDLGSRPPAALPMGHGDSGCGVYAVLFDALSVWG
jgi:hypothetical protein